MAPSLHQRSLSTLSIVTAVSMFCLLMACTRPPQQESTAPIAASSPQPSALDATKLTMFAPLPLDMRATDTELNPEEVALGELLYHDPRLSKNHDLSCQSCHNLSQYGTDGRATSPGHGGKLGRRNAQSVFNAALHIAQFWDGRAADVEEQAQGPIVNPDEMAATEKRVIATIAAIPHYKTQMEKIYSQDKQPISLANIGKAIGAFERTLVTPSRFDDFLKGDSNALTLDEQQGLTTFMEVGCTICHTGSAVGGTSFQKLGLVTPWPDTEDMGRYEITKQESDKMVFKVPSLRNVAKTAPYFHDGKVTTLKEAVTLMGKHQLGKELSDTQVSAILAFLDTLTGPLPAALLKNIELPAATKNLPKPDPR